MKVIVRIDTEICVEMEDCEICLSEDEPCAEHREAAIEAVGAAMPEVVKFDNIEAYYDFTDNDVVEVHVEDPDPE